MRKGKTMKYTVKIGEKAFEVEIEDINARPVVAVVDGERFEVVPDSGSKPQGGAIRVESAPAAKTPRMFDPAAGGLAPGSPSTLTAPLPGTVTEVFVQPGEMVETGHVVLIIEAMKMKNSIRAIHGGKVAKILVSAGQTVAHKQALVEFE